MTRFGYGLRAEPVNKRVLVSFVAILILAVVQTVGAQQPKKVPRIGYVTVASRSTILARIDAFQQGMSDLGYVEGKNILIEWRFGDGKPDRLPALSEELMQLKVDVIITGGPISTRRAKEVTASIP